MSDRPGVDTAAMVERANRVIAVEASGDAMTSSGLTPWAKDILALSVALEAARQEADEWKQAAGAEAQLFDESRRFNDTLKAELAGLREERDRRKARADAVDALHRAGIKALEDANGRLRKELRGLKEQGQERICPSCGLTCCAEGECCYGLGGGAAAVAEGGRDV